MGYKVKPTEVDVPSDDPFRNDRLERRLTAEALSRFVGTIDGPCVVSLDAEWGMGKTTFLRMWQEQLRLQGFSVVMFNAWDNDFANEPFLALTEELRTALRDLAGEETEAVKTLAAAAGRVLLDRVPALTRIFVNLMTGGLGGDLVEGALDDALALVEPELSRYGGAKKAMDDFREALATAANEQAAEGAGSPLVVLIDELDRCRPSYAVELLEVLKHLFAVKGVVFVLAVNRAQLELSVKTLYGADFDAAVYLRRFFDIDLRLPAVNRVAFIDAQMAAIWNQLQTLRNVRADSWQQHETPLAWVRHFFDSPEVDLRTAQQALQHLGLVLAMLEDDAGDPMLTATFALILRTRDRDLYERFVNREVDDEDVGDAMFGWVEPAFRAGRDGAQLEVTIILAAMEVPPEARGAVDENLSRLYHRHHRFLTDETFEAEDLDEHRSRWVFQSVNNAMDLAREGRYPLFREAARRVDLVAGDGRDVAL